MPVENIISIFEIYNMIDIYIYICLINDEFDLVISNVTNYKHL